MDITFLNPGADYTIGRIMAFQTEAESPFWSEPLYHFYPQLDRTHAASLPFPQRRDYMEGTLRAVYGTLEETINEKTAQYARHWDGCREQVTAALSDAFGLNCGDLFNDLRCNVTMNPIMPRFLTERTFDLFYLASDRGAIGLALHELVHFVWFHVWNRLFGDSYGEYERPSLKWILSEMVVEAVMQDERLRSINPYFPREQGGCVYPYFFSMVVEGRPILDTLDDMYKSQSMGAFMRSSYAYCQAHEAEIRAHIQTSEG